MCDVNSTSIVNTLAPNRRNSLQCTVGHSGRAIKGLVVCYVVWLWSVGLVCGLAQGARVWSLVVVKMAIESKYSKQHPTDTYRYSNTYHINFFLNIYDLYSTLSNLEEGWDYKIVKCSIPIFLKFQRNYVLTFTQFYVNLAVTDLSEEIESTLFLEMIWISPTSHFFFKSKWVVTDKRPEHILNSYYDIISYVC